MGIWMYQANINYFECHVYSKCNWNHVSKNRKTLKSKVLRPRHFRHRHNKFCAISLWSFPIIIGFKTTIYFPLMLKLWFFSHFLMWNWFLEWGFSKRSYNVRQWKQTRWVNTFWITVLGTLCKKSFWFSWTCFQRKSKRHLSSMS